VYSIFEDEENEDVDDELTDRKSNCTGAEETLVFWEKDATYCGIRIAPGEGKIPVPLHRDLNAEVLSFPTIYGGVERKFKNSIRITYTDIAKSEIRRYDRRACRPCKLLYSFKRSFNEKVYQAVQVCMRKTQQNNPITVGNLRTPGFIEGNSFITRKLFETILKVLIRCYPYNILRTFKQR
jgi:hypothetical protein